MANYFRLDLHGLAANLLVRLRRVVASPPPPQPTSAAAEARLTGQPVPPALPASQLAGDERKRDFNQRREQDPLGEGHAETWRTRLLKVAAQVVVSTRRVRVQLSGSWPHLEHYRAVCQAVLGLQKPLPQDTG